MTRTGPTLFRSLYLTAATPNSRYPATWLPKRLQILQSAHAAACDEQLEALWPIAWKRFVTGILSYRENSHDRVLETLALDALGGIGRRRTRVWP